MATRRPFIGGNWKMHGDLASSVELVEGLLAAFGTEDVLEQVDVAICPPFPYLQGVGHALRHYAIQLGGQDCSAHQGGAYTGQTSPSMLADLGCSTVLVGHSERRHGLEESDALIAEKLQAALAVDLVPVLCVGETDAQRAINETEDILTRQVTSAFEGLSVDHAGLLTVAYEPVWAIGTGRTASPGDAQSAHLLVRNLLRSMYDEELAEAVRIIYGGSVKAANAAELFACPDVDGGLIGGASLDADEFAEICRIARTATRAS
ncbi:MAG: triose-phosphate isomerase [Phycisphaerales bacterium]|nr:triose-phosphate isomerase [Phycisphaerales bacterium]